MWSLLTGMAGILLLLAVARLTGRPLFRFYLIGAVAAKLTYTFILHTPPMWFVAQFAYSSLCLLALFELLKRHGARAWWLSIPALGLPIALFVSADPLLYYQLVRMTSVVAAMLVVGRLWSKGDHYVMGFAVWGYGMLLSDVVKLTLPETAWVILTYVDPLIAIAMYAVWLVGLREPQWIAKLIRLITHSDKLLSGAYAERVKR